MTFDVKDDGNSIKKKAFKKLKYIPMNKLDVYEEGKLDAVAEVDFFKNLGKYEMRSNAMIRRGEDAEPYHVGVYHFGERMDYIYALLLRQRKMKIIFLCSLMR